MKKFKIIEKVLDTHCEFVIGSDAKARKYLLSEYQADLDECSRGFHHYEYDVKKDMFRRCIWLEKFDVKEPEDMNVLVHEVTHLVDRAFNDKGIDESVDNTEVRAGYMGYWVREFLIKMK